ncbi:ATP-binding cassette domain-containing protein [Nocardioides agariphilus]|uniref:ATP-binding cassette domain-containing protein n=1 Tax=Nocardioides agariphilus TaxID=433664 RepID=A0A930VNM3_9ACTN|nr:ATP-binding cassette domain-containing protein [Nocardioides agariphilus]MBF4768931.1 ATP-binding cassette domain-containing protein [Nocardioides agariphilus]
MSSLSLENVGKKFGSTPALAGVRLEVEPSVTGLLGPNGAGKTTLLRMAATVLAPDSGRIRILGRDPAHPHERVEIRRRLGYVPQEPGFYRNFTAFDFVDYVAVLKDIAERRRRHDEVRKVLDYVGLRDHAHQRIKALSGGMRQRLALAQALLGDPELLILDEATAGLDPEQRLRFREMISVLPQRPTVLISTHQTDDVSALCQRVVVLIAGTIRFDGTPAELAATASDRVWVDADRDERAAVSWRTSAGQFRHIGERPADAQSVTPTVDDAYLLLSGADISARSS